MRKYYSLAGAALLLGCADAPANTTAPRLSGAVVSGVSADRNDREFNTIETKLSGEEEAPTMRITGAHGSANVRLAKDGQSMDFVLEVNDIRNVTMAHIHMQAKGVAGPIVVWFFPSVTATAPLPGGDLRKHLGEGAPPPTAVEATFERFVDSLRERHPQLDRALVRRLARCYGTRAVPLLASGLGTEIAPDVFAGELAHLREHEWARSGDDVLWRRTKLGLHLDAAGRAAVSAWMTMQEEAAGAFSDER